MSILFLNLFLALHHDIDDDMVLIILIIICLDRYASSKVSKKGCKISFHFFHFRILLQKKICWDGAIQWLVMKLQNCRKMKIFVNSCFIIFRLRNGADLFSICRITTPGTPPLCIVPNHLDWTVYITLNQHINFCFVHREGHTEKSK